MSLEQDVKAKALIAKQKALDKYKSELPHLYSHKFFWWSRKFWESTNRYTFLVASNQSGKSSCQIRKAIRYCTDVENWPKWFSRTPQYGFYFYPSFRLATREFNNKWVKEFLPRGSMKDDAKYGWTAEYKDKEIFAIHFNSGMKIYFMSYTQKVSDLQASSPDFVCADEEMPMHLWGEVSARLLATKGPFSLVCTPTIGDDFWRGVFENNKMPNACVIKATMYDTVKFEDGSPGLRTVKEIEDYKAKLPTRQQIEVRVYAKFAKAESAIFPTFDRFVHVVPPLDEAKTWPTYAGIDIGSGGSNDPASITFVAVRPDMREARVIKTWRGNNQVQTSSIDILRKYQELKQGYNIVATFYDQSSREFYLNAQEAGEVVLPSDKKHQTGQGLMNTLFKHGMLLIEKDPDPLNVSPEGFPFWETLCEEIECMKDSIKKDKQPDDQCDSTRYAVTRVNFDFSHVGTKTVVVREEKKTDWNDRSNHFTEKLKANDVLDTVDREIEFYNEFNDL